jgi:hypothetical protein
MISGNIPETKERERTRNKNTRKDLVFLGILLMIPLDSFCSLFLFLLGAGDPVVIRFLCIVLLVLAN